MSSNNKLLKNISSNLGVEVDDKIQYNNYYLKKIANQTGSEISGHKSDNFLLKEIANNTKNISSSSSESSARISELEGTVVSLNGQISGLEDDISDLEYKLDNNIVLFLVGDSIVQTNGVVSVGAVVTNAGSRLNGQLVNFYVEE